MNLDFNSLAERTTKRLAPKQIHYATLSAMNLKPVSNGFVLDIIAEGPPMEELEGKGQTAKAALFFTGSDKDMEKSLRELRAIATGLGTKEEVFAVTKTLNERKASIPELIEALTPLMVGKKGWWITREVRSAIEGKPITTSDLVPWAMVHQTKELAEATNTAQLAKGNSKWVLKEEAAFKALSTAPAQGEPVAEANW